MLGGWFASNDNLVRIDGYARLDAMAGYRFGRYEVQLNVRNLLDEDYYETAHSNNNVVPAAGRIGLVTVISTFLVRIPCHREAKMAKFLDYSVDLHG